MMKMAPLDQESIAKMLPNPDLGKKLANCLRPFPTLYVHCFLCVVYPPLTVADALLFPDSVLGLNCLSLVPSPFLRNAAVEFLRQNQASYQAVGILKEETNFDEEDMEDDE